MRGLLRGFVFFVFLQSVEPPHDKTNKMACAPSEDSDQPGHPPSLIRIFAVRMKKPWVLSYPLSAQRRLIRLGECPGWSESSLGAHSFCWFFHVVAKISCAFPLFLWFKRLISVFPWFLKDWCFSLSAPPTLGFYSLKSKPIFPKHMSRPQI